MAKSRPGGVPPAPINHASRHDAPAEPSRLLWYLGLIALAISVLSSLLLVLDHFGGLQLPGCGKGSECAAAANSVWGKIPIGRNFAWPVSFLGFAYFFGAAVAWLASSSGVAPLFRHVARFGAAVSVFFLVIIVAGSFHCKYCLASHAGNLAFWIIMELTRRGPVGPLRPVGALVGLFVAASAVLLGVEVATRSKVQVAQEKQLQDSIANITASDSRKASAADPPPAANQQGSQTPTVAAKPSGAAPASAPTQAAVQPPTVGPEPVQPPRPVTNEPEFTGRYRVGPAEAAIRIVMFTDYQCQDCYNIEQQLVQLYNTRKDMSISIKHFPFNSDCNPGLNSKMHPNACWAARAAETAGRLWGPDGFWKMHVWLFDQRGVFETAAALENGIREMGYDPTGFVKVMSSDETLQAIEADVREAKQLGLYFTPMIFINGVELKGWVAPNALIRAVEQVAATNPPARSAAFDHPPVAFEKYIDDWRVQPQLTLPPDKQAWKLGPDDAMAKIVLWGDYQEEGSTQADAVIRAFAAGRNDVQYTYRHYPFNSDCNPNLKEQRFPNSCRAAKAAEAAGRLGGNDGYWKMHTWLMENREAFSDATLQAAAVQMGFDASAFLAAMEQPEVQANILDDIQAGKRLPQLRHGVQAGLYAIPTIFVNGRYVPRWAIEGQPVLGRILEEACGKKQAGR